MSVLGYREWNTFLDIKV